MKKSDAHFVKALTDNYKAMESLRYYIELKINSLKDSLVYVDDLNELKRIQGAINELKKMLSIRDEVNNARD